MFVDLGKQFVFPVAVITALIPDIVLWSKMRKTVVLIKLTVPVHQCTKGS